MSKAERPHPRYWIRWDRREYRENCNKQDIIKTGPNNWLCKSKQTQLPPSDLYQRFGMTDRTDPGETAEIWRGLKVMWEDGLLRPTVFDRSYRGLKSVVSAMKDLQARYVWGKAVVLLDHGRHGSRL
jgi:hypothetical protein